MFLLKIPRSVYNIIMKFWEIQNMKVGVENHF